MRRLLFLACLLLVFAIPAAAQTDIDVLYIQKTPMLNYDSTNGGWPTVGSTVTWNAKVKNWGSTTIPSFVCEWWMDGIKVQTNTVTNLAPGETRTVTYLWAWQQSAHTLEFRADTTNLVSEATEQNNNYSITTNALTYGSWVEQSVYDYFHAHQIELGDGANSFEDWCYRMVKRWNELFSMAVWPVSPNGIIDRIRVDKITIVPNGTLPIHGGYATNNPDGDDKTIDLMWGHPYNSADCQPGGFWQVSNTGPFFIDYGEIHELDHARYLVDHYGFDMSQDSTTPNVLVTDKNGNIAAGTPAMPYAAFNVVYYNKSADIMGGSNHFGEYAAGAWNRKVGIRGPRGNQNSPGDIGVYLNDLPQNNYFKFVDNTGAPLVGATISIYQATALNKGWYDKYYDNIADIVRTTDSNGSVNLGRNPFSNSSSVTNTWGYSNATFIIKVSYNGQEYFTFGEVSDFGIEYWKGNTQNAYYTVSIPWGVCNTATAVAPGQWKQEIYTGKLSGLVDVKALDSNSVGGFALRMMDRPISSGVGKDNFSCRFTRDIFFNKGTYKFIMCTDDGGRLYIDGASYIDHWVDGGVVPQSATVSFNTPGLHTVKMEYYDSGASAVAGLSLVAPLDTVPGPDDWKMEIYNSANLAGLVEVAACPKKFDEGFAMNWGDRGPSPRTGVDSFSVRFSRTLNFAGGLYRFTTVSEDGVRLYVDGQLKINHWDSHPAATDTAQVSLAPGNHTLVVETYNSSGPAQISLSMDHIVPDFDVTYISRTPRYDRYNVSYEYNIDPANPTIGRPYLTPEEQSKQRWPNPGEMVTYTAHVKNTGETSGSCTYKWYFDGQEAGSGVTPALAPGDEGTVTYSRPWDSETAAHNIKFAADPDNAVVETNEANNIREDVTNALSIRLHVWQSLYNWFASNAGNYADVGSFDDWAQQNVAHLNSLFTDAKFAGIPQGIPEHARIDEIVIEPDSTTDPDPSGVHAPADWPWDMRFGFSNTYLADQGSGKNYFETNPSYLITWDPAFIRALGPQLGLIDYSALDVYAAQNIAYSGMGHPNSLEAAAITTGGPFFSQHEAYALSSNAHKRRGFTGEHLYDLPKIIKLRVLDAYRRPLPNVHVGVFQEAPGHKITTLIADLTADSSGIVTLPTRTSFGGAVTVTGHVLRDNPFGFISTKGENGTLCVSIKGSTYSDYQFLEITRLNNAAWNGYGDEYTYDLQTNIIPEGRPTTNDLYTIEMLGSNSGYAGGLNGKILQYDGTAWRSMTTPATQTIYSIAASPDHSTIVFAANSGVVYIYAGGTWITRYLPAAGAVLACAVMNNSTFFVGNVNGELYRTTDVGASWTKIMTATSTQRAIRSIKFYDSLHGIMLPASAPAYYTVDGGVTWTPATGIDPAISMLIDCSYPSMDAAWLVNTQGSIYKSIDSGATWAKLADFGRPEPLYSMDLWPGGTGWIVSRYNTTYNTTVIKRLENGKWYNWPLCTSGSQPSLFHVSSISQDEAWTVGTGGTIMRLMYGLDVRSQTCDSLEQLKSLPDGAQVMLTNSAGLYVSAIFPDCVYLEKANRSGAIKVYTTDPAALSASATASGTLGTENGERVIRWGQVTCGSDRFSITPLALTAKSLGGMPNWQGISNLAMLVRIAGQVTGSGPGWITVDDGSGLTASDGFPGVKVLCNWVPPMGPGVQHVAVTGIATTESAGSQIHRVIRATGNIQTVTR